MVVKTIKMLNPPPIVKDERNNGKMHVEKILKYLKEREKNINWIELQGYFKGSIWYFEIEFLNTIVYWKNGRLESQDEYLVMKFHLDHSEPFIDYEHYYIDELNKRYIDNGRIWIVYDGNDELIEKLQNYLRKIAIRSLKINK